MMPYIAAKLMSNHGSSESGMAEFWITVFMMAMIGFWIAAFGASAIQRLPAPTFFLTFATMFYR